MLNTLNATYCNYIVGSYWMYDKFLSDFSLQMFKATKDDKRILNVVMIKAVFSNEPHIVKLLIDHGLYKSAEF